MVGSQRGGRAEAHEQAKLSAHAVGVGERRVVDVEAIELLRARAPGRPRDQGAVLGVRRHELLAVIAAAVDPEHRRLAAGQGVLDDHAALVGEAKASVAAPRQLELPAVAAELGDGREHDLDLGRRRRLEAERDQLGAREIAVGLGRQRSHEHGPRLTASGVVERHLRDLSVDPHAVPRDPKPAQRRAQRQRQGQHRVLLARAGIVERHAQAQLGLVAPRLADDDLVGALLDRRVADIGVAVRVEVQHVRRRGSGGER